MKRYLKDNRGITLVELMVSISVTAIIGLFLTQFFSINAAFFKMGFDKSEAQNAAQVAILRILSQLRSATRISSTEIDLNDDGIYDGIEFHLDSPHLPSYLPDGDIDSDSILNIDDPDDDNDISTIPQTDLTGYDIQDDDDDGDGYIDVRCRIYLTPLSEKDTYDLMMDYSYNEAPWGEKVITVCRNVVNDQIFTYFGSKDEQMGVNIDLDNDGTITATEIDGATMGLGGHGDFNGRLDTEIELKYINMIEITVQVDHNQDGVVDFETSILVRPPLLRVAENK